MIQTRCIAESRKAFQGATNAKRSNINGRPNLEFGRIRSKHQVGTDHRWAVALAGQRQTDQLEGRQMNRFLEHSIFSRSDPWGRNLPDVGVWNLPPGTHLGCRPDISESGKDIDFAFNLVMWIIGIVFVGTGLILAMSNVVLSV